MPHVPNRREPIWPLLASAGSVRLTRRAMLASTALAVALLRAPPAGHAPAPSQEPWDDGTLFADGTGWAAISRAEEGS
jgi:hypothetical protein